MKKVVILPTFTLQLMPLTSRPTTYKQSPTQPLHLLRKPLNICKKTKKNPMRQKIIPNCFSVLNYEWDWLKPIWELRKFSQFLANCILRFAVSLSENIFLGCLHENSENRGNQKRDNYKALNLLRHLPFCSSFTPASLHIGSDHQSYLQLSTVSMCFIRGACIRQYLECLH